MSSYLLRHSVSIYVLNCRFCSKRSLDGKIGVELLAAEHVASSDRLQRTNFAGQRVTLAVLQLTKLCDLILSDVVRLLEEDPPDWGLTRWGQTGSDVVEVVVPVCAPLLAVWVNDHVQEIDGPGSGPARFPDVLQSIDEWLQVRIVSLFHVEEDGNGGDLLRWFIVVVVLSHFVQHQFHCVALSIELMSGSGVVIGSEVEVPEVELVATVLRQGTTLQQWGHRAIGDVRETKRLSVVLDEQIERDVPVAWLTVGVAFARGCS